MSMRIVILPNTFPGPFRHLAAHLAALPNTKVLYLSDKARREVRIPGVRRLLIPPPQNPQSTDRAEYEAMLALRRGANTANALLQLRNDGFIPNMVLASAGTGGSFYAQDIFPDAFYAVHAEWFHTRGTNHTFFTQGKPRPPVDFAPERVRNLCQWNALGQCHLAVTSTQWQKDQYPKALAPRIHVLHEGVDTNFFSPAPGTKFVVDGCDLSHVEELITFSGRGLEPFRGFPQFYRALPHILQSRPKCHALIMASSFGPGGKKDGQSAATLNALQQEVSVDEKRVHFVGFRPYEEYRRLLRASTVHVFLTAPFALSSGLFEALSCGCLLVGADTEPVREVVRHGENGFLCDFWDTEALAHTVASLLDKAGQMRPIQEAARKDMLQHYDVRVRTPVYANLLLQSYAAWQQGAKDEAS